MFPFTSARPLRNRNVHNLQSRIAIHESRIGSARFQRDFNRLSNGDDRRAPVAIPFPSTLDRRGEAYLCSL